MKAEDLRKSILQLAIQGKLVKQNPDDEPASILIERIHAEKQRLAKEGKIKKDKTESFIYRSADNSYYEKIGNIVRCIDEEIPFEVPNSWVWCRLNNVCHIIMGQSPDGNSVTNFSDGIEFHQGKVFFTNRIIGKSTQTTIAPSKIAPEGSVLLCVRAPVGKVNLTDRELCVGRGLCSLKPFISIQIDFLYYLLETYEDVFVKQATGTTFIAITSEVVNKQLVPIPPLAEQQRIINQLEILEPLIAKYDKYEKKEAQLTTDFPDKLKKSILQSAIQGKLVAQNPDDEPASVLLEKIRKEKEQLIKAGKLKRDKNESFIYKDAADNSYYESRNGKVLCIDDESPFAIPDNWAWCKLGDIAQHNTGKTLDKERNKGTLRRYITTSNLYWGYFDLTETRKMPFKEEELERCTAQKGDLLICEGGEAGRSAIWDSENSICFQNHIHRVRPYTNIRSEYLLIFMEKITLSGEINIYRKGVGIKGLSGNALASILIPLPPLNEQKRIIEKIEQLFAVLS